MPYMKLLCSFQAQRNRTSLHDMEERSFLSILSDMIGFLKRFDIYKKKKKFYFNIFIFQIICLKLRFFCLLRCSVGYRQADIA